MRKSKQLLEMPFTTREERVEALIELKERCARIAMSGDGRPAVDAARLELNCLKQIAEEMQAHDDELLVRRVEAATQDHTLGRPSLAKKTSATES